MTLPRVLKTQFVKDLREKDAVSSPFLVKYAAAGVDKNGKTFLNLVLMDRTGEIEARIFDALQHHIGQVVRDALVHVDGRCQAYQGRRQIVVSKLQLLREDEVELKDFTLTSDLDAGALYARLLAYVESMSDPYYKALAEAVLRDDEDVKSRLKRAPAAKSVHHAYPVGLLEHVVSIVGILDGLHKHYGEMLDRDLLFLGGFFHDIAKLWELSYEKTTDYTTEGRLIGHLVMGVELVDRKIRELDAESGRLPAPFPEEKKLLVKHVILAHHGVLEYGSPKRPKVLEAWIVHMVDDMDSKVNAISKFLVADQNPGRWTGLNRQYERYFWKPDWAMKGEPGA